MKGIFVFLLAHALPTWSQETSCYFSKEIEVVEDLITVSQETSLGQATVKVEVAYAGLGWVGFGFSESGEMAGSTVVIGQPGGVVTDLPNPGKFRLGGYGLSTIKPLPPSRQTLISPSIDYNGTHTILRFTKRLEEDGETSISPTEENIAIYGIGRTIELLGIHDYNGAFPITLSACSDLANVDRAKLFNDGSTKRDLWKLHGYMMAAAWGIMVPLGVGSSLLRSIIPGEHTWFAFHILFNGLGLLLTTGGIGLAIYTMFEEGHTHFNGAHELIGLLLGIVVLFQGGIGMVRPRKVKEQFDKEEPLSKAARIRKVWEIIHKLFGSMLLAFAWWNCQLGINAFSDRFGDDHKKLHTIVFWCVTGGLVFATLFLRALAWLV